VEDKEAEDTPLTKPVSEGEPSTNVAADIDKGYSS